MTGMHKLRQNEVYTDVTLESGDVQIKCHRNVLAVASDFFKAMFSSLIEEGSSATVQLTMEPEVLRSVIDYIYTGEIELTADKVERLVEACDVLQLDTLKTACDRFMVKQIEPSNCIGLSKFAALYQLNELHRIASGMMKSEFKTVAFVDEFKELSCTELIELIKDDDVNVEDEDVVFESVLGWVRHNLGKRKESLDVIMGHVRLPYCSRNYLRHIGDKGDLLTAKCLTYVHEAMAFQADTVHQHEMSSCRTLPRTNHRMKSCLLVVGGVKRVQGQTVVYNHCHYHEEGKVRWKLMTDLPNSVVCLYSVCRVEGGLLLTGGTIYSSTQKECWLYDMATKKWEAMPPLATARRYHRSVSLDGCVYVVGGQGNGGNSALASVECLNVKRRHWSTMPDMPIAVFGSMVVTYKNKVFVFGGRNAQEVGMCCSQVLNVTRGSWNTVSDAPETCDIGAAVTLNDFIYLVGGSGRTCLRYEPASDSWTRISRPVQNHFEAPAVVWRGMILVAGGGDHPDKKSSAIEAYHPETDTWSVCSVASINEKLALHFMFNVDLSDV